MANRGDPAELALENCGALNADQSIHRSICFARRVDEAIGDGS
jgi:hypothetical protein